MKKLVIAIGALCILCVLLILYIILLQKQLQSINRQLTKRLKEHSRQPISLELFDSKLNALAANINKCLKAEENLRLDAIREEKHFKEMIANISHDLRTPLTAIKGYQQLLEKGTLSRDQMQKLKIAQKYADELNMLIESFFEYSYLLNSDPVLQTERINLTNLVVECLAESIEVLEERNLKVHLEECGQVFVLADKEMTVRIMRNLIRNCIQHAEKIIRVQVLTGKNAIISFSNYVNNASEIDSNRLFERFYTADKARSRSTGLGLSIVRLLAEQMGGSTNAFMQEGLLEIQVELPLCEG